MNFGSLHIRNFLTIGHADVQLERRGLNLLRGVNHDDPSAMSNGSGKSSVVDALCWALFGETARGESGDSVVNESAKKDCQVMVSWADGNSVYTVNRYRKHKIGKNELHLNCLDNAAGNTVVLTKGTAAETQEEIERALGCTYEVFIASIYAGQEAMPDLPSLTDKPLKLLIERVSGSERLERAFEIARAEAQAIEGMLTAQRTHLNLLEQRARTVAQDIERSKLLHTNFESERGVREQDARAAHTASLERIAKEQAQLDAAGPRLEEAEKEHRAALQKVAGLSKLQEAVQEFDRKEIQPLVAASTQLNADIARMTREAVAKRKEYDAVGNKVGQPCGACGKLHVEGDVAPVREILKGQLQTLVEAIQPLKQQLIDLDVTIQKKRDEGAQMKASIDDPTQLLARVRAMERVINAGNTLKIGIAAMRNALGNVEEEVRKIKSAPNPYTAAIEEAVARGRALIQDKRDQEQKLAALETELAIAQDVARVYSPAGVRAHILDTVTPFLNERTAEYLSVLSDGNITATWSTLTRNAKGEMKEKFAIDVGHAKGGKKFKLLSGGEKRKVRLATMLALQDLVASRATKPIDLWIGDEIDDALDPAGLERLMAIMEKKARERGTVIVVSHNALDDWIDQTTTVTKLGGVSSVEGALCV